jgi:hypothetical protein
MYNYSPSKIYRGGGGKKHSSTTAAMHPVAALENLPAVPDRDPSSSSLLFDNSSSNETAFTHKAFNLYDSVDNLDLNFDDDCDDSSSSQLVQEGEGGERRGHKDQFQHQMDEIEMSMKTLATPRFRLPDRPLKLTENR